MTLDEKVTQACHRIEELYNETDGHCYVSFSGGKDSTVILALIKMCEEVYTIPPGAIPAVFVNTGIELGITVDFVKWVKENYYPNVQIIRPEKSFDWVLKNKGKPVKSKLKSEFLRRYHHGNKSALTIMSMITGVTPHGKKAGTSRLADKDFHLLHDTLEIDISNECCKYMKKRPFIKYEREHEMRGGVIGIRVSEGGSRFVKFTNRERTGGKVCTFYTHGRITKAPIIDWTDEDVDAFVEKYHVPLSEAYTKYGFTRTGCMGCPYSLRIANDLRYLHDNEPQRYMAAMHWLRDVYIAQNVKLPFDMEYEKERVDTWKWKYEPMRQEMLRKYRPNSRLIKDSDQLSIFDCEEEEKEEE